MKFMNKKRLVCLVMAAVLALSLSATAFADNPTNTTTVTAEYQNVPISVTVPSSGKVVINPYGVDVEMPEDATDNGNSNKVTIKGQQIVTAPMAISNESTMNLAVNVTITGTVPAAANGKVAMKLSSEKISSDTTSKSAYVYYQAEVATDLKGLSTDVDAAAIAAAYAKWAPRAYDSKTDIVLGTSAVTKNSIVTLKAAKVTTGDNPTVTYKAGSIALARLAGQCVASPRDAWEASDGFTATIAYTFTPVEVPAEYFTLKVVGMTVAEGENNNFSHVDKIKVNGTEYTPAEAAAGIKVEVDDDVVIMPYDSTNAYIMSNHTLTGATGTLTAGAMVDGTYVPSHVTIAGGTVAKDAEVTMAVTLVYD